LIAEGGPELTGQHHIQHSITRRELLAAGAAGAALLAAPGFAIADKKSDLARYAPFMMGIQSYSLRGFGFDEALEKTKTLGLHYWEAFQAHLPRTEDQAKIKENLSKLAAADVKLYGWGVQGFGGDEKDARKTFEFAKAMGVKVISADPEPSSYEILDKLLEEYKGMFIAIHNHGPGARYSSIAGVVDACKGRHPRFGSCIDTGHFLRSGEDPVEAAKALGKRVFDVHLKDVKGKTEFTELGKGDLRTVDLLTELLKLKFQGTLNLEYEEHETDPMSYISVCLVAAQDAVEKARNRKW
jgi:inosose dehydratase